jgi:hypothetical protein
MTVTQAITRAFELLGILEVTDPQLTRGMSTLNIMLGSWEELLHYPTEDTLTLTVGTESYSIGSGGDMDTVRPIRLISAFIRDSAGDDHKVDVDMSKIDYDEIVNKDAPGRPTKLYYLPTYPLGYVYFNFAPDAAETFYLYSIKPFTAYTSVDDNLTQPIEYEKAIIYNLAIDLAPGNHLIPDQYVVEQAVLFLDIIGMRNATPPPLANFDIAMLL